MFTYALRTVPVTSQPVRTEQRNPFAVLQLAVSHLRGVAVAGPLTGSIGCGAGTTCFKLGIWRVPGNTHRSCSALGSTVLEAPVLSSCPASKLLDPPPWVLWFGLAGSSSAKHAWCKTPWLPSGLWANCRAVCLSSQLQASDVSNDRKSG